MKIPPFTSNKISVSERLMLGFFFFFFLLQGHYRQWVCIEETITLELVSYYELHGFLTIIWDLNISFPLKERESGCLKSLDDFEFSSQLF